MPPTIVQCYLGGLIVLDVLPTAFTALVSTLPTPDDCPGELPHHALSLKHYL